MSIDALTPVQESRLARLQRLLRSRHATAIYYLLPTIVPLLALTLYPLLRGIWLAFTNYNLYLREIHFIGLGNFAEVIGTDTLFWGSLANNLVWAVGIVSTSYVLGFFTALALNEPIPLQGFFRAVALIPWVCPAVVAGHTWRWIYDPNFGLLNYTLRQLGIISHNVGWLSQRNTALISCMVIAIWKLLPFMIVMLLAGLQSVPDELYDAASIDGAGTFGRMRYITLPLLNRVGSIAVLLCTIWAFNHFDSVYVLTQGGPGNRTMLLSIMAYLNAFRFFRVGYASAIGVIMLILLLTPMTLYIRRVMQDI